MCTMKYCDNLSLVSVSIIHVSFVVGQRQKRTRTAETGCSHKIQTDN